MDGCCKEADIKKTEKKELLAVCHYVSGVCDGEHHAGVCGAATALELYSGSQTEHGVQSGDGYGHSDGTVYERKE